MPRRGRAATVVAGTLRRGLLDKRSLCHRHRSIICFRLASCSSFAAPSGPWCCCRLVMHRQGRKGDVTPIHARHATPWMHMQAMTPLLWAARPFVILRSFGRLRPRISKLLMMLYSFGTVGISVLYFLGFFLVVPG